MSASPSGCQGGCPLSSGMRSDLGRATGGDEELPAPAVHNQLAGAAIAFDADHRREPAEAGGEDGGDMEDAEGQCVGVHGAILARVGARS